MDSQDSAPGLPPPKSRGHARLRIFDPGGASRREAVLLRPGSPGPELAPFLVAGHPFNLIAWTAEEWERLPQDQRPADACRGSRGNWYRFGPDADRRDESG